MIIVFIETSICNKVVCLVLTSFRRKTYLVFTLVSLLTELGREEIGQMKKKKVLVLSAGKQHFLVYLQIVRLYSKGHLAGHPNSGVYLPKHTIWQLRRNIGLELGHVFSPRRDEFHRHNRRMIVRIAEAR